MIYYPSQVIEVYHIIKGFFSFHIMILPYILAVR